ncbi:MAG: hypothetical protein LUG45_11540 [Clostridiales bacterium]|nr:hypothetical protein [Clostridiales bacterium]
MEARYLDGERWNDVNCMLFGGNPDFENREDSYTRRVTRIHGRALEHLAAIMAKDPPDDLDGEGVEEL